MRVTSATAALFALALPLLGLGGCAFGPKALEKSHCRYNEAVHRVGEEQFLLNVVRVRYGEAPLELDVRSIAAQFELSASAEARPFFVAPNPPTGSPFRTFTSVLPDVMASGASRPTFTLDPADDSASVRRFYTPISLDALAFLIQTNWPVSTVLRLWVERLNGVPNADTTSGPTHHVPPDFASFQRVAELFQAAQDRHLGSLQVEEHAVELSGPLPAQAVTASAAVEAARSGYEYRPRPDGSWVLSRKENRLVLVLAPGAESDQAIVELVRLLGLEPGRQRYEVLTAPARLPDPRTVSDLSPSLSTVPRSTSQVLFYLANGVEVPEAHLNAGLVHLPPSPAGQPVDVREITRGLFEVHVCKGHHPPPTAYAPVRYRDHWYYLDDSDQASKATLTLMLQLSRLDFKRQRAGGPALTLPVGR